MEDFETCKEHSGCMARIESLEKVDGTQWKVISSNDRKLNMILGAVLIGPFVVALLTFLTLSNKITAATGMGG